MTHRVTALLIAALLAAPATGLAQQLPQVRVFSVFPPGGQVGQTVDVKITGGDDLDDADRLIFSHPNIKAEPVMGEKSELFPNPKPVQNAFKVTIGKDVPPGVYELRAAGRFGISNARAFVVDDHPVVLEENKRSTTDAQTVPVGTTVFGTVDQRTFDVFAIDAKQNQRILVECVARRIDSRADVTLLLLDAQGREIQLSRDETYTDALLDFRAPADGRYFVKVYDFTYDGGQDYMYQLRVTDGPYIDFAFPPAAQRGGKRQFTLYGRNLPGGSPSPLKTRHGQPLEQISIAIDVPQQPDYTGFIPSVESTVEAFSYRMPSPKGVSNRVRIGLGDAPVAPEVEPNNTPDKATKITVPAEFVGRIDTRNDVDWVQFDAKKGQVFQIEMLSQRLGVPADPAITLVQVTKNDKGEEQVKQIATNDDGPALGIPDKNQNPQPVAFDATTGDSTYTFTVPEDGTFRIQVRDLYGNPRNDPDHVYRLLIREPKPDFELVAISAGTTAQNQVAPAWEALVRKGSTLAVNVLVFRQEGFAGEVEVRAEGLPAGVTADPVIVPDWAKDTTLVFKAADNVQPWAGPIKILGKAKISDKDVTHQAIAGESVWMSVQNKTPGWSRVTGDMTLGVTDKETLPFDVKLKETKVWADARAGKFNLPFTSTKSKDAAGDFKQDIALKATGLPDKNMVTVKAGKIDKDKNETELEVAINNQAPVGTFSFVIYADTQYKYSRSPDVVEEVKKDKERLDKVLNDRKETAKKAGEAKTAAEKAFTEATQAMQKTTQDATNAANALTQAQQAEKAAIDAAAKAKEAADKDAANKGLADAAASAAKQAEEAKAKTKAATDAKTAADKAAEDAKANLTKTTEAKDAATKAATDADASVKEAEGAVKTVDDQLKKVTEAAKPKDAKVSIPVGIVTLKITEGPIEMKPVNGVAIKQGDKVETDVSIDKMYGFDDTITLELDAPKGVTGIKLDPAGKIDKGQNATKLTLVADKNATPGEHEFSIKAKLKYNGQDLALSTPVKVKIDKVEEAK